MKKRTTSKAYRAAKALLRNNRDVVLLRYYNNYGKYRALKVLWLFGWFERDSEHDAKITSRRINKLRKQLRQLASYTNQATGHGGDIYGFEVK